MEKISLPDFGTRRREKLLSYEVYEYNFDDMLEGFEVVRRTLIKRKARGGSIDSYEAARPLKQRAWDGQTFVLNCYSGGHPVSELAAIYPTMLSYWQSYSDAWQKYKRSDDCGNPTVATVALLGSDFVFANQLICLGILLGHGALLSDIPDIIDFNNPRRDGMLERLLEMFVPGRDVMVGECTRHLPYFQTLKMFAATRNQRPALMKQYLADWYEASRREGYYNSHTRGDVFTGYWSWEAAAITYVLDIDDSSYRAASFYSVDLVDYARSINAPKSAAAQPELCEKAGQACPVAGVWETLDIPPQRRSFEKGELMQTAEAADGITVWRYIRAL
ncbi:PoNe immunity protein domain-containing protein [Pseudoduganella plicata]|uniref:PoNe immunity protein domain-containing protein n=1 Tax=Pseudoduganella plicata TaxID=321984 RepID=UPI0019808BAC|nr:PoNe immunity protein domain-containing protein [Pseudoduganella plicata]